MTIATLSARLNGAFVWLGLLSAALAAVFWAFYGDFKEVRSDVSDIDKNVAVQTEAIGGIEKSLTRIEGRLDGQRQSAVEQIRRPVEGNDEGRSP